MRIESLLELEQKVLASGGLTKSLETQFLSDSSDPTKIIIVYRASILEQDDLVFSHTYQDVGGDFSQCIVTAGQISERIVGSVEGARNVPSSTNLILD